MSNNHGHDRCGRSGLKTYRKRRDSVICKGEKKFERSDTRHTPHHSIKAFP
jgi:hypothetical protein